MRRQKCGENTRHIRFPMDLDEQLVALAAYHGRPVTEMVVVLLDEHINGLREMRVINTARACR